MTRLGAERHTAISDEYAKRSNEENALANKISLRTKSISKRFGGLVAVNKVSLDVEEGKRYAIIGPNGSGKTTFINLLTGFYTPSEGSVDFGGLDITRLKPFQRTHMGMARTFQNIRLFMDMNVWENIALGRHCKTRANVFESALRIGRERTERRETKERIDRIAEFLGIQDILGLNVANLPYGRQRIVEIGRAMASDPQLIMLDEPAAGMNAIEVQQLVKIVRNLTELNITVLLIEHNMGFIKDIADHVTVMESGGVIASGAFDEVKDNPAVIEAYLGKKGAQHARN